LPHAEKTLQQSRVMKKACFTAEQYDFGFGQHRLPKTVWQPNNTYTYQLPYRRVTFMPQCLQD
jgi:hypothetical protein